MTPLNLIVYLIAPAILSIPTITELVLDYDEYKDGKRDSKREDTVVRGMVMVLLGWFISATTTHSFIGSVALSVGIFVMFFDYIMGYLLTKNPFYLGTTSQSDMFLKKLGPWELLLARGLFFAGTVLLYLKL